MGKCVIVLGMHRGGTSLIANIVNNCGFYAGDENLLVEGDNRNARGYWEHRPLIKFNKELLNSVHASAFAPPSDEGYEELERKSSEPTYRSKALYLLEAMKKSDRAWFWKDPRMAVVLPFWKNILEDVIYVIPLRHPMDIALSLRKWHSYPISATLLIWQRYMMSILKGVEGAQNICFVEYEKLIEEPARQCERLYLFLRQFNDNEANMQQTIENMAQAVASELRHNRTNSSFSSMPLATEGQKTLYNYLQRKTESLSEQFDPITFPIYPGWREYLLVTSAMYHLWYLMPETQKQIAISEMRPNYRELFVS